MASYYEPHAKLIGCHVLIKNGTTRHLSESIQIWFCAQIKNVVGILLKHVVCGNYS